MAPEQVLGKNIGPQVDVYAFGVLVFELMTGSRPIVGDTVERIFYQILQEPLNTEPMRQAGIPEPIIDLVRRCTEKDPSQRPQGFGEVCARIRGIIHDWDAPTRPMKNGVAVAPPRASVQALVDTSDCSGLGDRAGWGLFRGAGHARAGQRAAIQE